MSQVIIQFQNPDEVVAVTGDGTNDAPAFTPFSHYLYMYPAHSRYHTSISFFPYILPGERKIYTILILSFSIFFIPDDNSNDNYCCQNDQSQIQQHRAFVSCDSHLARGRRSACSGCLLSTRRIPWNNAFFWHLAVFICQRID